MIPIHTTTIRVLRPQGSDPSEDPADEAGSDTVIAQGIRAVISSPSGHERNVNAQQEVIEFSLSCDPISELKNTDRVYDEETTELYEVSWVTQKIGLGLDHTRAGLKSVKGVAP
jgi:hypothetical protein